MPEPQASQAPKDGLGTWGPRAAQACSVSQERKVTMVLVVPGWR